MPVNDGTYLGWPFVNHAMEIRGTQVDRGPGRATIVYPRRKFTYVVEFVINKTAISMFTTDLGIHLQNGRLYATLKSIDHPKPRLRSETLRSYNKNVIIPTKMEYDACTMSFHDDNSSVAAALWREYRAFYQYEGGLGSADGDTNVRDFRSGNPLTGSDVRGSMEVNPSMGMKMRAGGARHFFESIYIYDLGADPDSVNVYLFMYPVINSLEHDGLDYEDRSGQVSMSMSFDYEGYYHLVGMNNGLYRHVLEQYLGFAPASASPRVPGHARMTGALPSVNGISTNALLGGPIEAVGNLIEDPLSFVTEFTGEVGDPLSFIRG